MNTYKTQPISVLKRCLTLSGVASLALGVAFLAAISASAQTAISDDNLIPNGTFDAGQSDWNSWAGGIYYYTDGPNNPNNEVNSICSIGWWEGVNAYKGIGLAFTNTDYIMSVRARTGDGAGGGVFMTIQDTTTGWSTVTNKSFFFPDADKGLVPGPWHTYSFHVKAADMAAHMGDSVAVGVGLTQNAGWNQQYGWLHIDWVQLAPATPIIIGQPQNVTNYAGASATMSASVTGPFGMPIQYQWYKASGAPVSGATNSAMTIPSLAASDAGDYYVVATSDYGSVQSSNATLVVLPSSIPIVNLMPQSLTGYPHQVIRFKPTVSGTPPFSYQWKANGVAIAGATTNDLVLSDLSAASAATYTVFVNNNLGSANASVTLSMHSPAAGSYEGAVLEMKPLVYLRFSDLDNTNAVANEGTLGFVADATAEGLYAAADGPLPPAFSTLESTNRSLSLNGVDADAGIPPLNLSTNSGNTMTMTCWLTGSGLQVNYAGLVFNRGGHYGPSGLDVHADSTTGSNTLAYHWAGDFWGFDSGLLIPDSQWCFAALVVTPTNGTLYLGNPSTMTLSKSVNTNNHSVTDLSGNTMVGWDNDGPATGRRYYGSIDEATIFNRPLSAAEIQKLFVSAVSAPLSYSASGGTMVLTWGSGVLQACDTVNGTYVDLPGATSPYNVSLSSSSSKFFRVRLSP